MSKLTNVFVAGLMAAALNPVRAGAEDAVFNGTITASCAITLNGAGTLAPNGDFTEIASDNPGGAAVTGSIYSNTNDYTFSVGTADWSGTATTTPPTQSTVNVVGTGVSNFDLGEGGSVASKLGFTPLNVTISGTTGGGTLEAGNYNAVLTLTCS